MLSSRISWFVVLLLVTVSLTAATCNKGSPPEESAKPAAAPAPPPAAPSPGSGAGGSGDSPAAASDADRAKLTLSGIPGMDFSSLSTGAQRELANVFSDEFCYCGCPHTLGACLKTHTTCRHAKRMALLAASEAQAGVPSTEIIGELGRYYRSFREGRATVKMDERMCKGASAKDAKVTLVEYSDFECPYCGHAAPMLAQLAKDMAGKGLRVCYAPFPLSGHPNGMPAAQAALYARDHGKFWEMHDLLFQNQAGLSPQVIAQLAGQLGLSAAEVGKMLDEKKKYVEELDSWKESGRGAGVDSTPSMFLNGRKFLLPPNPQTLAHTVDDELEWVANKNAWAAD